MHVDPATNSIVATTRTAYPPCGILAADKTGVWSTGASCGDVVARVDSRTNSLTTNPAGVNPVGIELAFGSVWVANEGSGNIDQIDPHSGRLVARLHIVGLPAALGIGFRSVWVNDDYGRVLRIKPQR